MTHNIDRLLSDEAVQYIAERHHISAREVIDSCVSPEKNDLLVHLEENERQIICDLISMYKEKI